MRAFVEPQLGLAGRAPHGMATDFYYGVDIEGTRQVCDFVIGSCDSTIALSNETNSTRLIFLLSGRFGIRPDKI